MWFYPPTKKINKIFYKPNPKTPTVSSTAVRNSSARLCPFFSVMWATNWAKGHNAGEKKKKRKEMVIRQINKEYMHKMWFLRFVHALREHLCTFHLLVRNTAMNEMDFFFVPGFRPCTFLLFNLLKWVSCGTKAKGMNFPLIWLCKQMNRCEITLLHTVNCLFGVFFYGHVVYLNNKGCYLLLLPCTHFYYFKATL